MIPVSFWDGGGWHSLGGEKAMPVYLVGFDVRNGDGLNDYAGLQNAVSKLEKHRLMPWLYLVSVPFTASALKAYLLNHMTDYDCMWISRVPAKANLEFAYQTKGGTSAWLKKHNRMELPELPPAIGSAPKDVIYKRANGAKVNGGHSLDAVNS